MKLKRILREMSKLDINSLDNRSVNLLRLIKKHFNCKSDPQVWKGIHGFVATFDKGDRHLGTRLDSEDLSFLSNHTNLRWVEITKSNISIGF